MERKAIRFKRTRKPESFNTERWDIVLVEENDGHCNSKTHIFGHSTFTLRTIAIPK